MDVSFIFQLTYDDLCVTSAARNDVGRSPFPERIGAHVQAIVRGCSGDVVHFLTGHLAAEAVQPVVARKSPVCWWSEIGTIQN